MARAAGLDDADALRRWGTSAPGLHARARQRADRPERAVPARRAELEFRFVRLRPSLAPTRRASFRRIRAALECWWRPRSYAGEARPNRYRQRFSKDEADEAWAPHLYLYVFPTPPNSAAAAGAARRYLLERAEEPHRSRLRWDRDEKPQARDTTKWFPPRAEFRGFYALPEPMPGLSECHVARAGRDSRGAFERCNVRGGRVSEHFSAKVFRVRSRVRSTGRRRRTAT